MDRKFIKGESVEDCLDSIDLVLQHWAPRLGNYIVGVIPPIPLLHYCKQASENGVIFAGIIPFTGKITKAFLAIGKYNVKPALIVINIVSDISHSGARIQADKPIISYQSDILVVEGDIVRVEITPSDGAEEFLVGLLCHPDISVSDRDTRLLSELKLLESIRDT